MSYTLELLEDLPVLFVSFGADAQLGELVTTINEEAFAIFEAQSKPIYYVVDTRNMKFNFNDILTGVQESTKGSRALLVHPKMKQLIVITNSKAISTVVKGLNTVTFGNINALVFDSVEEALNHIRANAA